MIKLFFFGTHNFAANILEKIFASNKFNIVGVVTAPDRHVGRNQAISKSAVKIIAEKIQAPIYQPESLKNFLPPELAQSDLALVVEYGKIIPIDIINAPKYKTLNIHGSILPSYRGASPIQTALLNGEKETGITLMLIDAKMDHGPILAIKETQIQPNEMKDDLSHRLSNLAADLFISVAPEYILNKITPKEQDHLSATYCHILSRDDGKINFSNSAEQIFNQYRALSPWPGIWCWHGQKRLKLQKICLSDNSIIEPGKIVFDNSKILIGCGQNSVLEAQILQWEGKKELTAKDFINGNSNINGIILN
jgi:methionyl-tRNA formyltransferase